MDNDVVKRLMWVGLLAGLGALASIVATRVAAIVWRRAFGEDPPESTDDAREPLTIGPAPQRLPPAGRSAERPTDGDAAGDPPSAPRSPAGSSLAKLLGARRVAADPRRDAAGRGRNETAHRAGDPERHRQHADRSSSEEIELAKPEMQAKATARPRAPRSARRRALRARRALLIADGLAWLAWYAAVPGIDEFFWGFFFVAGCCSCSARSPASCLQRVQEGAVADARPGDRRGARTQERSRTRPADEGAGPRRRRRIRRTTARERPARTPEQIRASIEANRSAARHVAGAAARRGGRDHRLAPQINEHRKQVLDRRGRRRASSSAAGSPPSSGCRRASDDPSAAAGRRRQARRRPSSPGRRGRR